MQCRNRDPHRLYMTILSLAVHRGCVRCRLEFALPMVQTVHDLHYVCRRCRDDDDDSCLCRVCVHVAAYPSESVDVPCTCDLCVMACAAALTLCPHCYCPNCAAARNALIDLRDIHPKRTRVMVGPVRGWPDAPTVEIANA